MRMKTIDIPELSIDSAISDIEKFQKDLKGQAGNKDALAKILGYTSANNGAYVIKISNLRRYGLLEKRELKTTELAQKIVYAKPERKNEFVLSAIKNVPLFAQLIDSIGTNIDEANLEAQLINAGVPQVEAMKSEKKIRKLYKTFTPYITNNSTAEKTAIESDFVKSDDIMQSNDYSGQSIEIKTTQSEVYKAILPSDGISLIVPKDKSKIALAKYLLERLENEIDAKNKKE